MAQPAALRATERAAVRALATRMRGAGRHKPMLLTGTNARVAAEALAKELRLDIFRVDLAAVVGKFIGETERNLKQVFADADRAGSILLFDEADALFGKRSEVKDSHDRFANVEVNDLLQQIEQFRGLVVLVSETQRPLPVALRRRLVVKPFPPPTRRA